MAIEIKLVETDKAGSRGMMFDAFLGDEVLVHSHAPIFKSCRVLLDRGFKGDVLFYRDGPNGEKKPSMRMTIEQGSELTVTETDKTTIRFSKWEPRDFSKFNQETPI